MKLSTVVKSLEIFAILLALGWLARVRDWEPAVTLFVLLAAFIGTHLATRPAAVRAETGHAPEDDKVPASVAKDRGFAIDSYIEGGRRVDVVEGTLSVDTLTWASTVMLPPFINPPEITFGSGPEPSQPPAIVLKTADTFTVKIDSSTQAGSWTWRARGQLLQKPDLGSQGDHA